MSDPDFWSCDEHAERLAHDSIDDAIVDWLRDRHPCFWSDHLEVWSWHRKPMPPKKDLEGATIEFLEQLFGDWYLSDPEETPEFPKEVDEAVSQLADAVRNHCTVWACDRDPEPTVVYLASWITNKSPDMLNDPEIAAWVKSMGKVGVAP